MIQPSYIGLYKSGELEERVEKAYQILEDCTLCPHHCHVDRSKGELGYCKTGDKLSLIHI